MISEKSIARPSPIIDAVFSAKIEISVKRPRTARTARLTTTPAAPSTSGTPAATSEPNTSTSSTKTIGKVKRSTRTRSSVLAFWVSKNTAA